ncbi:MAG: hypothetical protein ACLPRE_04105, partial [Limisphaerales bacterium]
MRHKNSSVIAFTFVVLTAAMPGHAQPATTNLPAPMNWSADQDHRNMMEQLGIKTLRPGAEGIRQIWIRIGFGLVGVLIIRGLPVHALRAWPQRFDAQLLHHVAM